MALELHEAKFCPCCNQPRDRCMNPAMAGRYQVHPYTCYAGAALEEARKGQKDALGMKFYVVDAGPKDLPPYTIDLHPIDPDLYAELTEGGGDGPTERPEHVGP